MHPEVKITGKTDPGDHERQSSPALLKKSLRPDALFLYNE
jgi:hypothetical protein